MDVRFSVCIVRCVVVGACVFIIHMLYASCGSSQCCILHDLQ